MVKSKSRSKSRSKSKEKSKSKKNLNLKKNVVEDAPVSTVRRPKKQPVISRVVTEKALQHRLSPYFGQNGLTGKRNGEKIVNKALDKQSDPIVNDLIHKHIQTLSGANL